MPADRPSPEPKGVPPMFASDSWQRPDAGTVRPPRPEWPAKITPKSFKAYLGPERLAQWGKACEDHGLDLNDLISQAGAQANTRHNVPGAVRHLDARGDLRVLINDGMRDFLTAAGTPDAARPVLY